MALLKTRWQGLLPCMAMRCFRTVPGFEHRKLWTQDPKPRSLKDLHGFPRYQVRSMFMAAVGWAASKLVECGANKLFDTVCGYFGLEEKHATEKQLQRVDAKAGNIQNLQIMQVAGTVCQKLFNTIPENSKNLEVSQVIEHAETFNSLIPKLRQAVEKNPGKCGEEIKAMLHKYIALLQETADLVIDFNKQGQLSKWWNDKKTQQRIESLKVKSSDFQKALAVILQADVCIELRDLKQQAKTAFLQVRRDMDNMRVDLAGQAERQLTVQEKMRKEIKENDADFMSNFSEIRQKHADFMSNFTKIHQQNADVMSNFSKIRQQNAEVMPNISKIHQQMSRHEADAKRQQTEQRLVTGVLVVLVVVVMIQASFRESESKETIQKLDVSIKLLSQQNEEIRKEMSQLAEPIELAYAFAF